MFLKGLETLRLRMEAHSSNAMILAQWLREQKQVEAVFYAGLDDHPGHALAQAQQSAFGGVLSFRVSGGREEAWRFIDATQLISLTANLGDAKSTIVHPATTTHWRLTEEERAQAGVTENLIRISAGQPLRVGDWLLHNRRGGEGVEGKEESEDAARGV